MSNLICGKFTVGRNYNSTHDIGAGVQQAIEYAEALDIKYVYASNGDGFVEQNLVTGEVKELSLSTPGTIPFSGEHAI